DQGAGPTQYASLKPNFITTSYVMKDVPAFISEPYLTTTMDHLSWLKFQLTTITWPQSAPENYLGTWGKLEERLLEDDYFGGRLSKTGKLKKWVGPTALQSLSTEEKAQKIVEYVASTMDWDGYYSFVAGEQLDEVLENGKGSSGDINLLLIALLRKEGIDAHPMLISTRSHGRVQEAYPLVSQFNHVIALAHIDSLWIPLDAISDNLAFGMITRDDLNHRGWLIIEGNSQWIDIHPMYTDKRITRAMVSINEENLLDVKLFVDCMEYDSFDANNQFSGSESEEEFMDEFFVEEYSDLEMESFEITSKSKEQFSFNSKFQTTDYLNEVGDMFYLQPLLHVGLEENFFKLEERKYPVDFGAPVDWQFNLSMILPEDIEFEALPKPSKVVLPNGDGEFIYNFQRTGNMVNLVSRIKVNKTLFEPEEYEALKNFFDYVVEKQAEQLVFRRKS
ncbi:MAG: transglutaminase-like domain-containing protein, partial [Bacteroidota bacterium]